MLEVGAVLLALIAAIRGMWSPCGLSMLSTMTPMAERLRGHRFATTAMWFIGGAIMGGASLGAICALGAWIFSLLNLTVVVQFAIVGGAALFCLLADGRLGAFRVPPIRRQVNEVWVERYRPAVYAAGFGWQLGAALTTYVMTAANYLLLVITITSGSPLFAFATWCTFGTLRGLILLVNTAVTSTNRLFAMHRFIDTHERTSRLICLLGQSLVFALCATSLLGPTGSVLAVATLGLTVATTLSEKTASHDEVFAAK
jgi:MFS family permease